MQAPDRSDFDTQLRRLDQRHAELCAASAALLEAIAGLEEADSWSEDDETSMSCFLAARLGARAATAREWVRVARALRALPKMRAAHADGLLSWDQLRPLTRFATAETDEQLSIEAVEMTVPQLYREAARHERKRRERIESDHRLRSAEMRWDDDGRGLQVEAWLPSEQGARFEQAVRKRARELERDDEALDPYGARVADALVVLATASGTEANQTTLVVHADARVLTKAVEPDADHVAETESGVQLSDEAVRRLACDAKVEWVLERDGRPIGIGRRGRLVRGALRRAVRHRDGGMCVVPGCERKIWVDAHHIVHWADGGPTNLDNLVSLCSSHHRRLHEGGWSVRGTPGRDLRFHDPGGRVLSRAGPRAPDRVAA